MGNEILITNKLTKRFKNILAVDSLDLVVEKGDVFGILGPNGSGKSTTLGMILGVLSPTSGDFSWFNQGNSNKLRKKIGATIERPLFYPYMSGEKNLEITSMIKECDKKNIDKVLEIVELYERKHDPFSTYSLGMKQRLSIASALLSDPDVLILDEPTNGLDPQGIADIRVLIKNIAISGKTIILASHLLDEVQKVCNSFCVLKKGKLIHKGYVSDNFSNTTTIEIDSNSRDKLKKLLSQFNMIENIEDGEEFFLIKASKNISIFDLNSFLVENGVIVTHLNQKKQSLEEQFLAILAEKN
ncbi:ATP-binding cassette domain-containing protein [bacterium]|nr:ATP-binding cassette domain-containing protein [bacterium]